ncbi:hypothetical protein ABZR86_18260 [Dyella marensis]|nr:MULTISPECIES: hypothetical protein [Dyella]
MNFWLRAISVLAFVVPWALPAFGSESNDCAQLARFSPPGSLTITRGEVIGQPGERAVMTSTGPAPGHDGAGVGYLVTGDKVDFVAACQGFSYVRYHGKTQTTTGWIDSHRLQLHGEPFIPLPPNAKQLCAAAERAANAGTLVALHSRQIPDETHLVNSAEEWSTPNNYTPLNVDGRPLAVVQWSQGGTCYTDLVDVRTSDLKKLLSPGDIVSRNPVRLRFGGNAWGMGVEEDVVSIVGKPMIRSSERQEDFELSSIDQSGDTQLVCHGRLRPLPGKPEVVEGNSSLCESIASSAEPVAMQPAKGHFTVPKDMDPSVSLEALQWGLVNLDNTGDERPVGVVNYSFISSGGCGSGFDMQVPLPLNGTSISLAEVEAQLQAFHGDDDRMRLLGKLLIRVVRHGGQTYVEVLDAGLMSSEDSSHAPLQSVWKLDSTGPKQVCKYRTRHYEVTPPTAGERIGT